MSISRLGAGLLTGIILLAGCGGATTSEEGGGGESAPAPGAAASTRDACALVDVRELEAIAGQPLTPVDAVRSSSETACELRAATGTEPLIDVTVQWTGGRDQAQAMGAGMAMAKGLMNEPGIDIEALTGSGSEPGLADEAFYSNLLPSWVLKGDVLIQVMSPMFGADQTRRTFLAVAKTAIGRL